MCDPTLEILYNPRTSKCECNDIECTSKIAGA